MATGGHCYPPSTGKFAFVALSRQCQSGPLPPKIVEERMYEQLEKTSAPSSSTDFRTLNTGHQRCPNSTLDTKERPMHRTTRPSLILAATIGATLNTLANCQTQTPTKSASASKQRTTQANPAQALPLEAAKNETLMLFWTTPPPDPSMRPIAASLPRGSAVWIGKSGYVATCYHVIKGSAGPFKVGIARGPYITEGQSSVSISGTANVFIATLIAQDPLSDVAILKVEIPPSKIQFVPLVTGMPMGTPVLPEEPIKPRGAALNMNLPSPGDALLLAGFP